MRKKHRAIVDARIDQDVSAKVAGDGELDLIGEQLITSSKAKITRTIGSPFHSPSKTERDIFSENLVCNESISTEPILVQSPVVRVTHRLTIAGIVSGSHHAKAAASSNHGSTSLGSICETDIA
jgi:hypothetical protein